MRIALHASFSHMFSINSVLGSSLRAWSRKQPPSRIDREDERERLMLVILLLLYPVVVLPIYPLYVIAVITGLPHREITRTKNIRLMCSRSVLEKEKYACVVFDT